MFSTRGSSPLSYHRIGHADVGVISDIVLEPEQVEHYLGSIEEIQSAVRGGPAHGMTGVKADGTLVGFYVLHPDRRDNSCWWLGWFALDQRYQGRGYGRMAMAQIMANFRHIVGCRRVRLVVSPANVHATRLYAQAGFHQVGVHTTGELILEVVLSRFAVIEDIIALLRASSVSKRVRRVGRLRLSPGPYAAQVIGVERGPPSVPAPRSTWRTRLRVGSPPYGGRPGTSLGRGGKFVESTYLAQARPSVFTRAPRTPGRSRIGARSPRSAMLGSLRISPMTRASPSASTGRRKPPARRAAIAATGTICKPDAVSSLTRLTRAALSDVRPRTTIVDLIVSHGPT
jgi:GNAT superfamily N-acetyltransferase